MYIEQPSHTSFLAQSHTSAGGASVATPDTANDIYIRDSVDYKQRHRQEWVNTANRTRHWLPHNRCNKYT